MSVRERELLTRARGSEERSRASWKSCASWREKTARWSFLAAINVLPLLNILSALTR